MVIFILQISLASNYIDIHSSVLPNECKLLVTALLNGFKYVYYCQHITSYLIISCVHVVYWMHMLIKPECTKEIFCILVISITPSLAGGFGIAILVSHLFTSWLRAHEHVWDNLWQTTLMRHAKLLTYN